MIEGDSYEYEIINRGVELSASVEGMCAEIGLRRGMGTKHIIDAVHENCPDKTIISIDPYGSILYHGREHMEPCRLDYTNQMKRECMVDIWSYLIDKPVRWRYEDMTDEQFFVRFSDGVPRYELEETIETKYCFAHLDGPHNVKHVSKEIKWFNERMDTGSTICIDDITPDFIMIEPIEQLFTELGWEYVIKGEKKGLWIKC